MIIGRSSVPLNITAPAFQSGRFSMLKKTIIFFEIMSMPLGAETPFVSLLSVVGNRFRGGGRLHYGLPGAPETERLKKSGGNDDDREHGKEF